MPPFLAFIAFLGGSLLIAAMLFYPLYLLVTVFAEPPAHKILTRAGMLIALIALVPFLRRMDLSNRDALGYGVPRRKFISTLARGWLAGLITMSLPLALLILLDIREIRPSGLEPARLLSAAAGGLVGGLMVGFLEETFFRGALYAGIHRRSGIWPATLLSALLFASLHFIRPQAFDADAIIGWGSGLELLSGAFEAYTGSDIWDSFAALFAVGVLLALLRAWHGNIAFAIGIHAGWVLVIKIGKSMSRGVQDSPLEFLTGSYDGIIGWLVAAWVLLLVLMVAPGAMRRDRQRERSASGTVNPGG